MRQYTALRDVNGRFFRENILRIRARFYLFYICINNGTSHHRFNVKKKKKYPSVDIQSTCTLFLNHLYFTRKKKERFSRKYGNTNHVLPFVKNSIVGKDSLLRTRIREFSLDRCRTETAVGNKRTLFDSIAFETATILKYFNNQCHLLSNKGIRL